MFPAMIRWSSSMPDRTYNLNGGFKPTMKRFADLDGPDFFPRWATFALIDNEKFNGDIWECACGDGTMSRVLEMSPMRHMLPAWRQARASQVCSFAAACVSRRGKPGKYNLRPHASIACMGVQRTHHFLSQGR
jgi:hypothetical protein